MSRGSDRWADQDFVAQTRILLIAPETRLRKRISGSCRARLWRGIKTWGETVDQECSSGRALGISFLWDRERRGYSRGQLPWQPPRGVLWTVGFLQEEAFNGLPRARGSKCRRPGGGGLPRPSKFLVGPVKMYACYPVRGPGLAFYNPQGSDQQPALARKAGNLGRRQNP